MHVSLCIMCTYIQQTRIIKKKVRCSFLFTKMLVYIDCLFWVFRPIKAFCTHLDSLGYRWRLVIEQWGFLACHTYCDTGYPFYLFISALVVEHLAVELSHPGFKYQTFQTNRTLKLIDPPTRFERTAQWTKYKEIHLFVSIHFVCVKTIKTYLIIRLIQGIMIFISIFYHDCLICFIDYRTF